jgi:general secretion pathway protein K
MRRQRGAALLTAMLTVVLVASMAAAALWQQWRSVEVETAERTRTQSLWILTGALDWARLILREDARSGGADHLGEPWAVPSGGGPAVHLSGSRQEPIG